jgi:hypothetical protein
MSLHIAVLNRSTKVSTSQAVAMTAACAHQLRYHAAPSWYRTAPGVAFVTDDAHLLPGVCPVYLFDDADTSGALGYHDQTPAGLPYGKVFAKTILDAGGGILSGQYSVSATLSHELLELFGDKDCNLWASAPDGYDYAVELGDPVENDSYTYGGVELSNFALPSYFDAQPEAGARFDYLGKLSAPFSMTSGGYLIRRKGGAITQVYGESYPDWKLAGKTHPAARTARRYPS